MHQVWRELGVAQGRSFVEHDEFVRFTGKNGKTLILYTDPQRLEDHMKSLAPVDAKLIDSFTGAIRSLGSPDMPVLLPMMTLAMMHSRNAGYPIGGSLSVSQALEARYLALGGKVHYKSPVEKILVETAAGAGDHAVGVRLTGGAEHRADIVLSAADGRKTIFKMLDGRYADESVRIPYQKWTRLGVRRDLSDLPHTASWEIDPPVIIGGTERHDVGMRHFCYDRTLAPAGKSVVIGMFPSNHAFWAEVAAEQERYEAEKKHAGITYIDQLDRRFPGLAADVEAVDVATPLTWERFTGNWEGSIEGWMVNRDTAHLAFGKGMSKTLPGLENFYMAGQWVEPGGGVPTAALSGRNVVKLLCKADGKRFEASEA
jgi:phytoene dehydrogenase-like protein